MTGKEIYKIYAPYGAKWIEWVRPVPFVAIDTYNRKPLSNWTNRKAMCIKQYKNDTAIFIDLPGTESIETGISLAQIGYRPIPLFNGTDEQINLQATTDTYLIERCLINGSERMKKITLNNNANPAFLLDSLRTNRYRSKISIFDNSWDLYKQDIPTPKCFKENGINKIIVIGNKIQRDLRKIFFEFQNEGIEIFLTDGYNPEKKVVLKKTIKERLEGEDVY